jgi:DNA-binding MarR family transcriptional regulator
VIILNKKYGHFIRILHWCTDQAMTAALEKMDLTAAQGRIMGFLAHQPEPPCPRDIETEFHLSHPTVSGLLFRLEQKGFISLQTDRDDRRCKRIFIQPKGQQCLQTMHQTILGIESRLVQDFTEEEKQQFSDFLCRAISNMGVSPCYPNLKEESQK